RAPGPAERVQSSAERAASDRRCGGRGALPRPPFLVESPPHRPASAGVREFFNQNLTIIVFAHGVMFFALGFAVWLQRRRATRLTLTSSLIWLAAFAFVESLAVWGYAFVPIQASAYEVSHPELITALH